MQRLLFICPDLNIPAGGIKQIYRQVSVLNQLGYESYVVHGTSGFRCNWFENESPVLWDPEVGSLSKPSVRSSFKAYLKNFGKSFAVPEFEDTKRLKRKITDIFVLPEFYGLQLEGAFKDHRKVIYNQNCYYTFRGYRKNNFDIINSPYLDDNLLGVIVASEDAVEYMNLFLAPSQIHRVFYGIDSAVFKYSSRKKQQIAYMPRKLSEDVEQVLSLLELRGSLMGWNVQPIEGKNENEVAHILEESALFLSFNHREGFGMPPAEAMSCGCVVVGYCGNGGVEYMKPEFSFPVGDRNIKEFVFKLESAMTEFTKDNKSYKEKSLQSSEYITKNYSMLIERTSIKSAWDRLLQV